MKVTREFVAGALVIISLAIFYWVFNFLKGENLFDSGDHYYVIFEDLSGLEASNAVEVRGAKVGRVEEIVSKTKEGSLYPEFVTRISVDKKYALTNGTVAKIKSGGLTGNPKINLLFYPGNKLESGDTLSIKGGIGGDIFSQLDPTKQNLDKVLLQIDSTLALGQGFLDFENQQITKLTLKELNATVRQLNATLEKYGKLASSANQLISENQAALNNTIKNTSNTMKEMGAFAGKLNRLDLEETFANFRSTSDKLNSIIDNVNKGQGSMGKLVTNDELYTNLSNASNSLNLLLEDLKNHPKRYVQFSIFGKKDK